MLAFLLSEFFFFLSDILWTAFGHQLLLQFYTCCIVNLCTFVQNDELYSSHMVFGCILITIHIGTSTVRIKIVFSIFQRKKFRETFVTKFNLTMGTKVGMST